MLGEARSHHLAFVTPPLVLVGDLVGLQVGRPVVVDDHPFWADGDLQDLEVKTPHQPHSLLEDDSNLLLLAKSPTLAALMLKGAAKYGDDELATMIQTAQP